MSYYPRAESLGVVLPSNSPGVHSLWVPAFAMKTPLVLKPGSAEAYAWSRVAAATAEGYAEAIAARRGRPASTTTSASAGSLRASQSSP
jgi:hypothetical protein